MIHSGRKCWTGGQVLTPDVAGRTGRLTRDWRGRSACEPIPCAASTARSAWASPSRVNGLRSKRAPIGICSSLGHSRHDQDRDLVRSIPQRCSRFHEPHGIVLDNQHGKPRRASVRHSGSPHNQCGINAAGPDCASLDRTGLGLLPADPRGVHLGDVAMPIRVRSGRGLTGVSASEIRADVLHGKCTSRPAGLTWRDLRPSSGGAQQSAASSLQTPSDPRYHRP